MGTSRAAGGEPAEILERLPVAFLAVDAEGTLVAWNPAAEALFGWTAAEVVGRPFAELGLLPGLRKREPRGRDQLAMHRDGRLIAVVVGVARLGRGRGRIMVVCELTTSSALVQASAQGFDHVDRLAALGELAAGLAHELSQPLTAARIAAERGLAQLAKGLTDPETSRVLFEMIRVQLVNAGEIIGRVRGFARDFEPGPPAGPLDPVPAVRDAVDMVRDAFGEAGVAIALSAPAELPAVVGHRGRLEQVVVNLLINARDAILDGRAAGTAPGGGRIAVSLAADAAGRSVVIVVADDGPGIPAQALERMFDPFYSTKPAEHGTGLGLTISRAIVAGFGGTLTGGNRARGAAFAIELPIAAPL